MSQRHAYLIMAHNQWEMLQELLRALDDIRNDIYLHIDKKASVSCEHFKTCVSKSRLIFTKRYNVVWGGTQLMKCTLSMLEEAVKGKYDYYHLISGVDYPIKSQNYIHSFFKKNFGKEFVEFDWAGINSEKFKDRVQYYHFFKDIIGKGENNNTVHRTLAKLECMSISIQTKLKVNRINYDMHKGSNWFSLSNEVVAKIVAEKRNFYKRYCFSANCDEIWLQTFIMESSFSKNIADSNMRYIKWIQGNPSPEILTVEDYDDLMKTDKLFARKFDYNKDREIIEKIRESFKED